MAKNVTTDTNPPAQARTRTPLGPPRIYFIAIGRPRKRGRAGAPHDAATCTDCDTGPSSAGRGLMFACAPPIAENRPAEARRGPAARAHALPRGWRFTALPATGYRPGAFGLGLGRGPRRCSCSGRGSPTRTHPARRSEAVRSMQHEHEPARQQRQRRAGKNSSPSIVQSMRTLQGHNPDELRGTTEAGDALEAAGRRLLRRPSPPPPVTASGTGLRLQLTRHIADAPPSSPAAPRKRAQWVARRPGGPQTRSTSA